MLKEIQRCENLNDIYTVIIENSYKKHENNYFQQKDIKTNQTWKYGSGYYLELNTNKKYNIESTLDTLCLNIRKKLMQIYNHDIKQTNDFEYYESMTYTELYFVLSELNKKLGFEKLKKYFCSVQSANKLCSIILTLIANRNIDNLRNNKTCSILAKCKNINGKTVWEYEKYSFVDVDSQITTKNNESYSIFEYFLNKNLHNIQKGYSSSADSMVTLDDFPTLAEYKNETIIDYLVSKMDCLTETQINYLKTGIVNKKHLHKNIINRYLEELKDDKNVKISFDEKGNLKSICKNNNLFDKAVSHILSIEDAEEQFICLCNYLKKNNSTSDILIDFIYSLDVTYYNGIVNYLNTNELSNKYIYITFKNVIKELKNIKEGVNTTSSFLI